MGVSKVLDKRYHRTIPDDTIECMKKDESCMFSDGKGKCISEWCIFDKMPKVVTYTKKINCVFCNKTKEISALSGMTEYICQDCRDKIKELMHNERDK